MVVDVQHHVNVGTAIAHIDDAIRGDPQSMLQLLDYRDLAVAGGNALDGTNLAGTGVKFQLRPVDMFGWYHAGQRRNDDFTGCGRYDEKGKSIAFRASRHEIHQRRYRAFESNPAPRLHQVFTADAAKFRIVADQIGQLAALLDEIAPGKTCNTILESGYAQQLAQHESRILEAQRLVKV